MIKRKRLKNRPYGDGEMFMRLWRTYLRRYAPMMAVAGMLMVIEGSTLGLLSWLLKPTFDLVFVGGRADAILWVGAGIFGLFALRAVTGVIQRIIVTRISNRNTAVMQADLLEHVLTLDNAFFQSTSPGTMISRVASDASATQGIWQALILGAGRDVVSLISLAIVAILIDPMWTLVAIIGTPLLIVPNFVLQRYIRKKSAALRDISAARTTRLDEIFHGVTPVKLNGLERYQHARFVSLTDAFVKAKVKSAGGSAMIPGLVDLAIGLGFFLVLLYGGGEIVSGEKTVGDFMSFFAAMTLAFQPMRRLASLAGTWQNAAASLERVFQILDMRPTLPGPDRVVRRPDLSDTTIKFEGVRLSYSDTEVLRDLEFTAEAGQTTALVGPSGAGKSTIFNLLTRLVEPDAGRVTIGGQDIAKMELGGLRSIFSVVTQDTLLFDETIRENILLGRNDISEEQLRAAIEAANVAEFADAMPDGLQSRAGPRGSMLSGGQRQRVAIARAILRDTPILLLDEATSSLDSVAEAKVQSAIEKLSEGRTVLVIAHRLSTVARADKIVTISKGRVDDQGTQAELLERGGLFANLHALQFNET